uniref:Nitrophorin 1A n=1 Tax=Rhodnius prolixus TaxID=13249 RepID=Q7YT11_RHOPR|nr:nitrophorin 1A precursor [Rhodnius prolixus]
MRAYAALVVFVVALWMSGAEGASGCLTVDTVKDFNKDNFFTGSWYITHYKLGGGTLQDIDKNCTKFLHKKTNDGKIREVFSNYNPNGGTYSYDISFASVKTFDGNNGKYTAKNVIVNQDGTKIDDRKLQVSYIDTDYSKYSVVYVCDPSAPEYYLYAVQSRNENINGVKDKVETALGKVNLKLKDLFDATTLSSCKYDEDTLKKLWDRSYPEYEKE